MEIKGIEIKDLAGFSEPAKELIRVFASAVGTVYEPWRIVREAEAQAKKEVILTLGDIESERLRRSAVERLYAQELQKQQNIEAILSKAASDLQANDNPSATPDRDWIRRFALEAQEVSDGTLQELWSRLLAGEFRSPGKYPRRVFRVVKDLEPQEAKLLEEVSSKVMTVENDMGQNQDFLNGIIYEEWFRGNERNRSVLNRTEIESIQLLEELGIVDSGTYQFGFTVDGLITSETVHLSPKSSKRVYSSVGEITPEYNQPNLVRSDRPPSATDSGRPMIHAWMKRIIFDAWRITNLGQAVFSICCLPKDAQYFQSIKDSVLKSGIKLRTH